MKIEICGERYSRESGVLPCTFLAAHDGPCSWQDVYDAEHPMQSLSAATAMDTASLIMRGDYDPYLELLLNAAHNRKRALRGVRGFTER